MITVPETAYAKQVSSLRYWLLGRSYHVALRAFEFAQQHHVGLRKDNVSPEFSHQMFIAGYARTISSSLMQPEETLAAIFLHDVCEDYDVGYDEIENRFGRAVRVPVELLTKKKDGIRIPDPVYYERMGHDPVASIAKSLDRAHNIFTMSAAGWGVEKQERYLGEVFELLLPMMKAARRRFSQQESAYENVKTLLLVQAKHIRLNLDLMRVNQDASVPCP